MTRYVLKVEPRLRDLIPPPTGEELDRLRESIHEEGIRVPLDVWDRDGEYVLLDGHNRYRLSASLGKAFEVHVVSTVRTIEDAEFWILRNQLGRRNLPDALRIKLALQLRPHLERKARERQSAGGEEKVPQHVAEAGEVREQIAKAAGVSREQVRRAEVVYAEADEETIAAMESGAKSVRSAYQEVRPPKPQPAPEPEWVEVKDDEPEDDLAPEPLIGPDAHDAIQDLEYGVWKLAERVSLPMQRYIVQVLRDVANQLEHSINAKEPHND